MKKKIFAIILVSIFIISAITFVSAQETSDSGNAASHSFTVKIDWKDAGNDDARPDSITVDLMKNGEVIGTKKLNKDNSWSATFNVEEEGNFSIKEVTELSDYSASVNDSPDNKIVITYTLKGNASGEPQENASVEKSNTLTSIVIEESVAAPTNTSDNDTANSTDDNSTNTTINNNTDNSTNNNTDNSTDNSTNNNTDNNATNNNGTDNNVNKNNVTKHAQQIPKKEHKKPPLITKNKLIQAGIPVAVLVIAILAALVFYRREK